MAGRWIRTQQHYYDKDPKRVHSRFFIVHVCLISCITIRARKLMLHPLLVPLGVLFVPGILHGTHSDQLDVEPGHQQRSGGGDVRTGAGEGGDRGERNRRRTRKRRTRKTRRLLPRLHGHAGWVLRCWEN